MNAILVKLICDVPMPIRGTVGSAGLDLFFPEALVINPGEITTIPLGLCLSIPTGCFGKLEMRSSFAQKGLVVLGGVIDSDYTGEIKVVIGNISKMPVTIPKHSRVVQLVVVAYKSYNLILTTEEDWALRTATSQRGVGGFGSTGAN